MGQEDIPKTLLDKHPELAQIDAAIRAYLAGEPIDARCPKCGNTLNVKEVPETGELWVTCGNGCTVYHERYKR